MEAKEDEDTEEMPEGRRPSAGPSAEGGLSAGHGDFVRQGAPAAGGWTPETEFDPTSGLPIGHSGADGLAEIDPTSGLPLGSLADPAGGRPGGSGFPGGSGSDTGAPESPPAATRWGASRAATQRDVSDWGASRAATQRDVSDWGASRAATQRDVSDWGASRSEGGWGSSSSSLGGGSWQPGQSGGSGGAHPWGSGSSDPQVPMGSNRGRLFPILVAIVVVALASGLIGGVIGADRSGGHNTLTIKSNTSALPTLGNPQTIIGKVEPALVSIETQAYQSTGGVFGSVFGSQLVQGAGTGMIISSDGLVLTNNHVINGATQIQVNLYGQSKADPATVVGTDPSEDLAVIKVQNVSNLPTVTFADSAKVQVGDSVLAFGNALALGQSLTVTEGIVSALNRSESAGDASGSENLTGLIQTDAAINAGNSGGPLVNAQAQVIGMNTAVAASSAGNAPAEGIGFAISSDTIQSYLPKLEKGGVVASTKAYMGVGVVDASTVAGQFNLPSSLNGAFVCSVVAGSPADAAGIQAGDVITAFNGNSVGSASALTKYVQSEKAGNRVTVSLWSAGSTLKAHLTLGTEPSNLANLPIAGQQLC